MVRPGLERGLRWGGVFCSVLLAGFAVFASPQGQQTAAQKLDAEYKSAVKPLLDKHCTGCHSGAGAAAGLDLGRDGTSALVAKNEKVWEKVVQNVRAQIMPPGGAAMSLAERDRLVSWVERAVSANCSVDSPGKVTIRRLNRAEYNNTVRDLLAVDIRPADEFPSDDIGHGFDNIGDVLSLSPLHLEMYLKAARKLADAAIVTAVSRTMEFDLTKLTPVQNQWNFTGEGAVGMFANARIGCGFDVKQPGEYTLEVTVVAQQAGPDLAEMSVGLQGRELQRIKVSTPTGRPNVVKVPVSVGSAGQQVVSLAFVNDYYNPNHPDPAQRDRNLMIASVVLKGPEGGSVALTESHRRLIVAVPSATLSENDAARAVLTKFMGGAYRRPATLIEVDRGLDLFKSRRRAGDTYLESIKVCVQAVLASPSFLFRVELDDGKAGEVKDIGGYETASRLSYFLWSSMPDEQLLAAAANGRLGEAAGIEAQVKRMLADRKAEALGDNFASQWLQTRRVVECTPDPVQFPGFDERLKADLQSEVTEFFMDAVRNDRSAMEFVTGNHTMLNRRLAQHYGIAGAFDDVFRRVDVSRSNRGGVLGMGAVLTATSNPNRTSPVKRGKFVMEVLLGTPPPPPPPNVGVIDDSKQALATKTIRERLDQHRSNPECAGCHRPLDALGFSLENYDAVGKWRTSDGVSAVDNKGELPGGQTIEGVAGLRGVLAARKDDFLRHLVEEMLVYATGRGLTFSDSCMVRAIVERVKAKGGTMQTVILEIVKSDAFRKRGPVGGGL